MFKSIYSNIIKKSAKLSVLASLLNVGAAIAQPNIIVIFTDDQGYQDLGTFGSPNIKTPHLDKMAEDGVKLSKFYFASAVCSPSRASLLTGRLGAKNGTKAVYYPEESGLKNEEITIADMLKPAGYATAIFGKWHLGDTADTLPLAQGFDEFYGVPYSNDMMLGENQIFTKNTQFMQGFTKEKAITYQKLHKGSKSKLDKEDKKKSNVPVYEGNEIVEFPAEQTTLTERYFDRAMSFIATQEKAGKPFFVYLTPAMPHVPLFASERFKGKSEAGLYGDVIEEIDWNVGRLRTHLAKLNLADDTLIIFSSDNGPWLRFGDHGGSALPYRDGKSTNFEGGVLVPTIAVWPSKIKPKQISTDMTNALDLLPTIAAITGAKLPKVSLDGADISKHLFNVNTPSGRNINFYSTTDKLGGIRKGNWKYIRAKGWKTNKGKGEIPFLFNLKNDISETNNLYLKYPEKVKELEALIKKYESEI